MCVGGGLGGERRRCACVCVCVCVYREGEGEERGGLDCEQEKAIGDQMKC